MSKRTKELKIVHFPGGQGADKTHNRGRWRSEYERLYPQDGAGWYLRQDGFRGCAPACHFAPAMQQ